MANDPTQERVKELLHHDPDTGLFTWLVDRMNSKAGGVAGPKDGKGYPSVSLDGKTCGLHRLAVIYMSGQITKPWVDHKDCDPSNNRWNNLREATRRENRTNSRMRSDCKSGKKGATLLKNGRFLAQITLNGKAEYIGKFDTAEEAHQAYLKAANDAFGEFARAG